MNYTAIPLRTSEIRASMINALASTNPHSRKLILTLASEGWMVAAHPHKAERVNAAQSAMVGRVADNGSDRQRDAAHYTYAKGTVGAVNQRGHKAGQFEGLAQTRPVEGEDTGDDEYTREFVKGFGGDGYVYIPLREIPNLASEISAIRYVRAKDGTILAQAILNLAGLHTTFACIDKDDPCTVCASRLNVAENRDRYPDDQIADRDRAIRAGIPAYVLSSGN